MADRRGRPTEPGEKLGFPFVPVPEEALDAKRDGRLSRIDPVVLGIMLREARTQTLVFGPSLSTRKIAARLGVHSDTIYRSFRRLSETGIHRANRRRMPRSR